MTSKAATRFLGSVPVKGARKRQSEEAAAGAPNDLELNCGDDDPMAGEETLLRMVAEEQEQQCHEPKSPADECVETSFVPGSQSVCEKSPRHSPSTQKQLLRGRRRSKKVNVFHSSADSTNVNDPRRLELSYWGLPELLLMRYRTRGVLTMFEWQAECLGVGSVLEGGNLVYSAPTSAGKTLVAELLMIKRVLETKKKAVLILPFVSLAREKMFGLQFLLQDLPVRVHGFMGSQGPAGGLARADIAVCTIEKGNSLINRLLEAGQLEQVGVVVVDELHLLGDPSRGYLLELLLTKIRYMSTKDPKCSVQIIGMSATLPNLDLLASWLDADLFRSDFRPVPLVENIKVGRDIYDSNFKLIRTISPPFHVEGDSDHLIFLCLETVLLGHSVLVFCPTKKWCETLADTLAKEFCNLGRPRKTGGTKDLAKIRAQIQAQLNGTVLAEVIEQLRRCPAGLDPAIARVVGFGVAYHHAGLTFDERDIIEGAFKSGSVRVLVATSTLSSGVNLPARRVIVRSPFTFQNQLVDTLSYKQMVGESILVCRANDKSKVSELVAGQLKPVTSCLVQQNVGGDGETLCSAMKRAILEVVASGAATTPVEVEAYASCTMLAASLRKEEDENRSSQVTDDSTRRCIQFLEENEFIRLQSHEDEPGRGTSYIATQLGLACLASSLSPDEGLHVFTELQKARQCFVLENELHIIYQVVPIYVAVSWPNLDWMNYLSLWESLSPDMRRVGELVGVEERFLVRAMRGTIAKQTPKQMRSLAIHQRFYTALALHDLVNEVPLAVVSRKYGSSKGMLQSLQQAASTFAGMVTVFCHRLGWLNLELLLGQFQDRLQFGVRRELIDLCRLTTLNGVRARALHAAGLDSVSSLAAADQDTIENILHNAAPFESAKQGDGESERDALRRKQSRCFWLTGQKGVTLAEAAKAIVEEARDIMQKDLGVQIDWQSKQEREALVNSLNESKNHTKRGGKRKSGNFSLAIAGRRKKTLGNKSKKKGGKRQVYSKNNSGSVDRGRNLVLNAMTKRRSLEESQQPTKVMKVERSTRLQEEVIIIPKEQGQNGRTASFRQSSSKKSDVSEFDLSKQMEEILQEHEDDADLFKDQPRVHPNASETASPVVGKTLENDDVFGDSFADNLSSFDEILAKHENQSQELKTPGNKNGFVTAGQLIKKPLLQSFCPKTPGLDICSEELLLRLSATSPFEGEVFHSSPGKQGFGMVNADSITVFIVSEKVTSAAAAVSDTTLSDSFLERAMDTHMSAMEGEKVKTPQGEHHDFLKPSPIGSRTQKTGTGTKLLDTTGANGDIRSMKKVLSTPSRKSPRTLPTKLVTPNTKNVAASVAAATPDTPSSSRSSRLTKRRKQQTIKPHKISPGLLILSDSDSEAFANSPMAAKDELADGVFQVVDVCASREVFNNFRDEWKQQREFSLAVACVKVLPKSNPNIGIGARVLRKKKKIPTDDERLINLRTLTVGDSSDLAVCGLAVSWQNLVVFYIALADVPEATGLDDSLSSPTQDSSIQLAEKLTLIQRVLGPEEQKKNRLCITAFDANEHFKTLYLGLGVAVAPWHEFRDPKVAHWLLQPNEHGRPLSSLVMIHGGNDLTQKLLPTLGSAPGCGSVALNPMGRATPRQRALAEVALARGVMSNMEYKLRGDGLWKAFVEVEMRSMLTLARMELNGVGFSQEESERQRKILEGRMAELEDEAYQKAGHRFSLTSPGEICQVLYRELGLPLNGDPSLQNQNALTRSKSRRQSKLSPSSSKDVLIKLKALHPLPGIILEWRKLNMAITKVVFPMQRSRLPHRLLGMDRIYTKCQTLTATGRIALHEPNIQNIPRDFDVTLSEKLRGKIVGGSASRREATEELLSSLVSYLEPDENSTSKYVVSMRHAVVASKGFVIVSADYSQLELRILAHLSGDKKLCSILNAGHDVFKAIAASWKRTHVDKISDEDRQQAKQICYGMLYGMGARSLGEALGIVEDEAAAFLSEFRLAYPGVHEFIDRTVKECRSRGFVTSMAGRRRYLPAISDGDHHAKAAAERQAINTTVQGSAADLVKTAMNEIDRRLFEAFPHCQNPIRPAGGGGLGINQDSKEFRREGAYFLLQMHDELLYEVACSHVVEVAQIVGMVMENVCQLSVKTPVNIKVGPSWGQLQAWKKQA